jgi:hypothetical protein
MVDLHPVVQLSGFARLDRFIHKKYIFFCIRQSRLAGPFENQKNRPVFECEQNGPFENRTQKVSRK